MAALTETLLAVFAYASTIVATLRAGSRVLYLREHNEIGVMDGPLILGPNDIDLDKMNESGDEGIDSLVSPLWEVAFSFEQSIRLALDPDFRSNGGDKVVLVDSRMLALLDSKRNQSTTPRVPYSLSPYPTAVRVNKGSESAQENEEGTNVIEENIYNESVLGNEEDTTKEAEDFYAEMNDLITGNITETNDTVAEIRSESLWERVKARHPNLSEVSIHRRLLKVPLSYLEGYRPYSWIRRKWSRTGELIDEDTWTDENEVDEEEWDYATCLSTEILYNATATTTRFARLSAYAPGAFADLRSRFGIEDEAFEQSIFGAGPFVSYQSNSKGAARVGGIFFFTRDGAYMIKTIKKEEARTLMSVLPKYHKFMRRNARRSLITRICGMYGVRISDSTTSAEKSLLSSIADRFRTSEDEEHIFVVTNAVFPAEGSQFISERFDLKGSTVGRECSEEERETKGANAVLKDLDLAREVELVRSLETSSSKLPEYGIHIGPTAKAALLSQLRRDVHLLVDCNVMDYSLLVGVVNMDSHHIDAASMNLLELSHQQELKLRQQQKRGNKPDIERLILSSIVAPIRILSAPPLFFCRRAFSLLEATVSSILTRPLPYYGAGICGVDGGAFSVIHGKRSGNRAIYYMGLIDFLQPWTTRKVIERQLKGILGYDKTAISCVDPQEYASRFLDFIDAHVS